jgi:hypothetical protein
MTSCLAHPANGTPIAKRKRARRSTSKAYHRSGVMKDFLELVSAFVEGNKPKKWWASFALSPFDADPGAFATSTTKHHLRISTDAFSTRVTLCVRGKHVDIAPKKDEAFAKMLARLEKKAKVSYRLDRSYVAGSPVKLKKAVRDWLANVRPADRPASAFESVAARHGADAKTVARWGRVLEGGAGYEAALAEDAMRDLLSQPTLIASACEFLEDLTEVPELGSKRAYKRAARLMSLLVRDGDPRSLGAAERFFVRAKKSPDAVCYVVPLRLALESAGSGARFAKLGKLGAE